MTEQNPQNPAGEQKKAEVEIDLDALRQSISEEVGSYVSEIKSNPRRLRVALISLGVTTGVTYFAAKKGAASALKGASQIQADFLNVAEMAAKDASVYANIAEQNAAASYQLTQDLGRVVEDLLKATNKIAKAKR